MRWPVMIFAAGLGTRMRALTKDRPKPLIPVAGRPLIDHALALTEGPAFGPRVVNLHYKAQMLRQHLAGQDILFADETDQLLDTGGGLRAALPLLDSATGPAARPVITLNSDAVWQGPPPLQQLIASWQPGMGALLLLLAPAQAKGHLGRGDFLRAADGRLTRAAGQAGLIYSGAQIITPALLEGITDRVFSLNQIWDRAAAAGQLFGCLYDGQWCDVGRPENIPLAEALCDV